jgi:hypothetical protein
MCVRKCVHERGGKRLACCFTFDALHLQLIPYAAFFGVKQHCLFLPQPVATLGEPDGHDIGSKPLSLPHPARSSQLPFCSNQTADDVHSATGYWQQ